MRHRRADVHSNLTNAILLTVPHGTPEQPKTEMNQHARKEPAVGSQFLPFFRSFTGARATPSLSAVVATTTPSSNSPAAPFASPVRSHLQHSIQAHESAAATAGIPVVPLSRRRFSVTPSLAVSIGTPLSNAVSAATTAAAASSVATNGTASSSNKVSTTRVPLVLLTRAQSVYYARFTVLYANVLDAWQLPLARTDLGRFAAPWIVQRRPAIEIVPACLYCNGDIDKFGCSTCKHRPFGSLCALCNLPAKGMRNPMETHQCVSIPFTLLHPL